MVIETFSKKRILLAAGAAVVLLFPMKFGMGDGGSVQYAALFYNVTKVHRMVTDSESARLIGYEVGWDAKILGVTIYRSTSLLSDEQNFPPEGA